MKTTVELDYRAILANSARPVHLAFQFTAPASGGNRERPIAFSIVLDRSGSMGGEPLAAAKRAARTVVQNLRRDDWFSLVTFEDHAQLVVPLNRNVDKRAVLQRIDAIVEGGSTNLTGGWMLGRDALRSAPEGTVRRQLLLTDGQLNLGITEPSHVKQVVVDGLERDRIRTSTLGFGNGYDENLLADLAMATGGTFYDANQADALPAIFAAELDGLQKIVIQNLRLRINPLDFVDGIKSLAGLTETKLPDGRTEYAMGDLTADEERVTVFELSVLPIPLNAGTKTPAASLEDEALVEVEIVYDEIAATGITSRVERHTVRVRPTQSPSDVVANQEVLPWVSAQQAAEILNQALAKRDAGEVEAARLMLENGIARLKAYAADAQIADGLKLLQSALAQLADTENYVRSRKSLRGMGIQYSRRSSTDCWASEEPPPSFKKKRPDPKQGPAQPETDNPV